MPRRRLLLRGRFTCSIIPSAQVQHYVGRTRRRRNGYTTSYTLLYGRRRRLGHNVRPALMTAHDRLETKTKRKKKEKKHDTLMSQLLLYPARTTQVTRETSVIISTIYGRAQTRGARQDVYMLHSYNRTRRKFNTGFLTNNRLDGIAA